jgi:two-component system response regulator RpaA
MIVDDDPNIVALTQLMLKRRGYQTVGQTDPVEAVKLAMQIYPDLMIVDLMMPFMDGFEVAALCRKDPKLAQIPILMISAKGDMQVANADKAHLINEFLTKPVGTHQLIGSITAHLGKSSEITGYVEPSAPQAG